MERDHRVRGPTEISMHDSLWMSFTMWHSLGSFPHMKLSTERVHAIKSPWLRHHEKKKINLNPIR